MKYVFGLLLLPVLLTLFSSCAINDKGAYERFQRSQKGFKTSVGTMAYRDEGKGTPVILLHGVPTSSWMYRKVIPGLAKNHRVIAVDLIGFGSSAKPEGDPKVYEPAEQARRVRALARSLGLSDYSLVFHDMGGLVAWEMMRQDSGSIDNLVVLNTIVRKEGFNPPGFKAGMVTEIMTEAFTNEMTSGAILTATLKNMGLTSEASLSEAECYGYVEPLRGSNNEALKQFYTSFDSEFYARLEQNKTYFKKFKGKTLVLWGEKDKVLTTKQIPFLKKNLRVNQKDIHIYPEVDHFLAEENPGELVRQITNFLGSGG